MKSGRGDRHSLGAHRTVHGHHRKSYVMVVPCDLSAQGEDLSHTPMVHWMTFLPMWEYVRGLSNGS